MHTNAISIDPPGARELDDAIAVRREEAGWIVEVLLPDVPSMVRPGTPVDAAARERGLTVYAEDAVRTPMLPRGVVEALSLSPEREGPAVAVTVALSPDLVPVVGGIGRTRARTAARLSYGEADRAIADAGHPHHRDVHPIWDLALRLHADRAAGTGARFDIDEHVFTNEEGRVVTLDERHAHRSNMAVMEIMILVNAALAAHASASGLPILYRNHRYNDMERGDRASAAEALARIEGIGRREAAQRLRRMAHLVGQAEMGTEALGHFGLDLAAYAWFTSPLRRYCDVVNLRALLDGVVDPGIADLAGRLTELHRRQKGLSSDHHARSSRRRLVDLLERGRHDKLDQVDVHTILRAIEEGESSVPTHTVDHLRHRMATDDLSGRDMAALLTASRTHLGDDFAREVAEWVDGNPARILLLAEHEGRIPAPAADAEANSGAKAELQIAADRARARLTFGDATRTGPPHAPVFDVEARWQAAGDPIVAHGSGRTKRAAENSAAAALARLVPNDPAPSSVARTVLPKAPKTELLERAAARRAVVTFSDPARTGPDHAPRFEVEAVWKSAAEEIKAVGAGAGKKDAERDASEQILARLGR